MIYTSNSVTIKTFAKRCQKGRWSFLGPGDEEKWYGTHVYKPEGKWNTNTAVVMELDFVEISHPVFRASGALDRGFLRKKDARFISARKLRMQIFYMVFRWLRLFPTQLGPLEWDLW